MEIPIFLWGGIDSTQDLSPGAWQYLTLGSEQIRVFFFGGGGTLDIFPLFFFIYPSCPFPLTTPLVIIPISRYNDYMFYYRLSVQEYDDQEPGDDADEGPRCQSLHGLATGDVEALWRREFVA